MLRLTVYSRYFGIPDHPNSYPLTRTSTGWRVKYNAVTYDCDKAGRHYLYEGLDRDGIYYPNALPRYMSELWDKVDEEGLSEDEIQAALDKLGAWISIVERHVPVWRDRKYV